MNKYSKETFDCPTGEFKIVGEDGFVGNHKYYIIEFNDGYRTKARLDSIKNKDVNNPYYKVYYGVGCMGLPNKKLFKKTLYNRWLGILRRCYDINSIAYKYYGAKGVTVCDRWKCFEYFLEDVVTLEGYDEEKINNKHLIELDKDVLCEKLSIFPKIYSPKTCIWLCGKNNNLFKNKDNMKLFVAIREIDGYKEISNNIGEFSRKWNLDTGNISRFLRTGKYPHKGWKFYYLKQEAINLVKEKYNIEVNEDIAEAILISEFNNFE